MTARQQDSDAFSTAILPPFDLKQLVPHWRKKSDSLFMLRAMLSQEYYSSFPKNPLGNSSEIKCSDTSDADA